MSCQTAGLGADVSAGGLRINVIPKEGSNRISGSAFAGGIHRSCQADNVTPQLRARDLILGSTPHPEALFMQQIVRTLTMAEAGVVSRRQVLICDRDRKWSRDVRRRLRDAGIRVVLIPERAPNANAYAERCAPRRRREETAM